jgi:hypothetical protein
MKVGRDDRVDGDRIYHVAVRALDAVYSASIWLDPRRPDLDPGMFITGPFDSEAEATEAHQHTISLSDRVRGVWQEVPEALVERSNQMIDAAMQRRARN